MIHFAHANGFPAASYRRLFAALKQDVIAKDMFGHHPDYPVAENWPHQVDELIDYVSENSSEKVTAVGHSFGGVISYMAVCKAPELFSGLIMLDPPLLTGAAARVFQLLRKTPMVDRFTPAGKSARRTTRWSLEQDLVAYFKARALFRHMPVESVQDYIAAATETIDGESRLRFSAEVETALFRTVPHNLHSFAGQLQIPATLVVAEYTNVCKPYLIKPFLKANPSIRRKVFTGAGHLFPLEHPARAAEMIQTLIRQQQT